MEDHSRVLEPLDTNSLSLSGIHSMVSSSGDTVTSTRKEYTPFEFGKDWIKAVSSDHTPLKWKTQLDEFTFNSNSTPVRSGHVANAQYENLNIKDNSRKRRAGHQRRLLLSGAGPHQGKNPSLLKNQVSKLDLLDNDKLTSFPIAPPLESVASRNEKHPTNEYRMKIYSADRRVSLNPTIQTGQESVDGNELFLIEDYIPRVFDDENGSALNGKRVSISDLKSKYYKRKHKHKDSLPLRLKNSTSVLATHNEEINVLGEIIRPTKSTEQDQYLSNLMVGSSLKHCVICEKPLYELSSRLHDTGKDYREIVCLGCTSRYEEAAALLEEYEFESTVDDSIDNSVNSIDFQDPPEILVERSNKRLKTNQFSSQLIRTLQIVQLQDGPRTSNLSQHNNIQSGIDPKIKDWFLDAKRKLRWRWRMSGLLPKFLTSSSLINEDSLDE